MIGTAWRPCSIVAIVQAWLVVFSLPPPTGIYAPGMFLFSGASDLFANLFISSCLSPIYTFCPFIITMLSIPLVVPL